MFPGTPDPGPICLPVGPGGIPASEQVRELLPGASQTGLETAATLRYSAGSKAMRMRVGNALRQGIPHGSHAGQGGIGRSPRIAGTRSQCKAQQEEAGAGMDGAEIGIESIQDLSHFPSIRLVEYLAYPDSYPCPELRAYAYERESELSHGSTFRTGCLGTLKST